MKKLTALILTICLVLSLSIYAAAGELDLPENAVTEPTLSEWEFADTQPAAEEASEPEMTVPETTNPETLTTEATEPEPVETQETAQ